MGPAAGLEPLGRRWHKPLQGSCVGCGTCGRTSQPPDVTRRSVVFEGASSHTENRAKITSGVMQLKDG
jgi:hypothetical protein